MKIGLFVDVQNVYFTLRNAEKKKLNYEELIKFCKDFGTIKYAICFNIVKSDKNEIFRKRLTDYGYEFLFNEVYDTAYDTPYMNVQRFLLKNKNEFDKLIFVSSNSTVNHIANEFKQSIILHKDDMTKIPETIYLSIPTQLLEKEQ